MKMILATALAVATLAGTASAQTSSGSAVRIPFADLHLSTPAGAAAFETRLADAARTMCRTATRPASRLNDRAACTAAVRADAISQLPTQARGRYAATSISTLVKPG